MFNLFQLTNAPLDAGAKRFCKSIIASDPEACVFVNGSASTKEIYPIGVLTHDDVSGFLSKWKSRSIISEQAQLLADKDQIIFTDMMTASLLPASPFEGKNLFQLLTRFPEQSESFSTKLSGLRFIAISDIIAQAWNTVLPNERIITVKPAYLEEFENKKTEHQSFVIGVIADLEPGSGVETVIQSLHRNRELLPQVMIILVGDGSEKKRIQWLVDHLHLRQRIQFVTSQKNYAGFLENFDVVVFPNEFEQAFNHVLLDALAQGIPTIATSIGYNEEIIEQGQNGLLFEPRNSHTLSQHLINLYNHPDWMEHYQQKGPQMIAGQFNLSTFKID